MAILNFIKSGSYTRISKIHWEDGMVTDIEVATYASKPDNSYLYVEDYDDTNNMNVAEEGRVKGTRVFNDLAEKIHESHYSTIDQCWDPDIYSNYFGPDAWKKKNLHAKCYEYLLSLPAFSEASSDE
tara:strand:+ start:166 stop:546 length:381 start_codon:yes stop_codon:yes gene_type:complete